MTKILGFKGKYRWLSNFPSCPIEWDGVVYPSPENAYQAAKTLDLEQRKQFLGITSSEAKRLGTKVTMRPEWEEPCAPDDRPFKVEVMKEIQRRKYKQPEFRAKLLKTDAYIEETNTWGDKYWGVCDGEGKNWLGVMIVEVRDEIRMAQGLIKDW